MVVVVVASAGGTAACTALLRQLPADTTLAVIVQLDGQDLDLVSRLAAASALPVVAGADGTPLAPGRVVVVPPRTVASLAGGRLRVTPSEHQPGVAIDRLCRSVADECTDNAIAVVLSGNGTDGEQGVRAVRDSGGFVLVQDLREAEYPRLPSIAIASGYADRVLPAAHLGAEVARIGRSPTRDAPPSTTTDDDQRAMSELFPLLSAAVGVDFERYRKTTVQRRLQRRLATVGAATVADYVAFARANPGELHLLAQDLLIAVTQFFRDPEVFEMLARSTFPELIRHAGQRGEVRIWVPGCSSGEEAFSLLMVFAQVAERMRTPATCRLFATDANEAMIARARRATYPEQVAADIGQERLERFFVKEKAEYRVSASIRERCVFSRHDVTVDPPLSRMDMISCRNLLIYLEGAHDEVMRRFHFALRPGGYLLLGGAETAASSPQLFEVADTRNRLFRRLSPVDGRVGPGSIAADTRFRNHPLPPAPRPDTPPDEVYEELVARNEELVASNEELQSLNEELESTKEEACSANEELRTLNEELQARNAELAVANAFAASTLDTVRSGLVVLDRELRVVMANRSFYRAFHLAPGEVEKRPMASVLPACFAQPALVRLLEQVRDTNQPVADVDVEIEDESGRGAHRVLVVAARRFAPGDQLLLSVDDVTQLRELESSRRQSQKMEAIGHLAAGLAHDFNNLLTPVLGGSQLLRDSLPPDTPLQPIAAAITVSAQRAAELTRQLLAFAGKSRTVLRPIDLSTVVRDSANLMHAIVPAGVELQLDLDCELPLLLADLSQMHQIVDNLVQNALDVLGQGPGRILIRTGKQRIERGEVRGLDEGLWLAAGDYLFAEVTDNGAGMTEDVQRQMFDPFFTTKFTGRGLGLAVVQGIVRHHRGTIQVTSVVGRGTTMRVLLAVNVRPVKPAAEAPPPTTLPRGTATVLLVDDEPLVLRSTAAGLQHLGYDVVVAGSGREAMERLRATPSIAAVLLDASMAGMDGLQTLARLREIRPELPVVISSGLGDVAVEQAFLASGVTGFLHKPYTVYQLAEGVAACFRPQP